MQVELTTYYLEMRSPAQLKPKTVALEGLQVIRADRPSAELQHFLYRSVGGKWYWYEKAHWTYAQWLEYAQNPLLHTHVAYVEGTPAGYFQLHEQPGDEVELVYFGLMQGFLGLGLGGHLLTLAVQTAWGLAARRVWVHTCSLDHPSALANYLARGFVLYKTETQTTEIPDQTPGVWDGA